jgi:hypothetical protein
MTARLALLAAAVALSATAAPLLAQNVPPLPPPPAADAWQDGPDGQWGGPEYHEMRHEHGPGPMIAPPGYGPGPMMPPPPGYAPGMPGYYPGWVMPPVVWVRVPIMHERRDCDCEQVIEEEVTTSPAPRAQRIIPKRAIPGKRIRLTK